MANLTATSLAGVLDRIGNTPLIRIDGVWIKLECSNPGGSVKDRIATFLIQEAARRGELEPDDTIVEATSGNTGIAMAMVGRALGYRVMVWMPEHMSEERRRMLEKLGADVRLTPRSEGFEGPIERRDAFRDQPGYYVPDQFGNPDNIRCHRTTTGAEIVAQLRGRGVRRVDAFVAGVGTGGTLMGVGQALEGAMTGVRLVAVEPAESAVMSGGEPGEHEIQGIGDGFIPPLVRMELVDEVARVRSAEARAEARRIHRHHGFCVGLSSGANSMAARRLRDDRDLTVVTLWPDCSDRYVSMGLEAPGSTKATCPLHAACSVREAWTEMEHRA